MTSVAAELAEIDLAVDVQCGVNEAVFTDHVAVAAVTARALGMRRRRRKPVAAAASRVGGARRGPFDIRGAVTVRIAATAADGVAGRPSSPIRDSGFSPQTL